MLRTTNLVRVLVLLGLVTGMLGSMSVMPLSAQGPYGEDFDGFAVGATVGAHADWYDGDGGPIVNASDGVAGSKGLSPTANIFNWTAHPFSWENPSLTGVVLQMDFETGADAQFDDDRCAWTTNGTSTSSSNQFGAQLDHSDGGIVTYWKNGTGGNVTVPIVTFPTLSASTWYRFRVEITRLTATSARLDVSLVQLDGSGNPTGNPVTGTLPDTARLAGDAPATTYFAASLSPSYQNYDAKAGEADNAYFEVLTSAPPTCYALALGHTGQGSDPMASLTNSSGCSAGHYVAGEVIGLSGAVPDGGWEIAGWTGTADNSSAASTDSLTMPGGAQSAAVSYTEIEPPACTGFGSGYTLDEELRIHADWFYEEEHLGPKPTAGAGVGGSVGLSNGDSIFTWVARPFYWNAPGFLGVNQQMDFQTDDAGHLEDDRIGWMISDTDDDSSNFFGIRIGPGGSGDHIEGIWDGVGGGERTPPIKDLPSLSANTWYRVWAIVTKLTATSAKIQVVLAELNASGMPWKYITSGLIADTSTLGADTPDAKYFTEPTWPAFRNSTSLSGAADLACLHVTTTGSVTVVKTSDPAGGTGFSFDAGNLGTFSLDDGGSKTFEGLVPGNYDVIEIDPLGWDLDNIICTGGDTGPLYQDPIINCGEDDHQDPVLPTVSDPLTLVPDDDEWTEYQEPGSSVVGVFASPTENPPVMSFYGIVPNGLYQVRAGLFRDSNYRYYYGYDPAEPRALSVDVDAGPQGEFVELELGTVAVTDTVFALYADHADLLWDWGASEYYAWSWIRLVPSPAITEGVAIHLGSGEDVTCTFTNVERPAGLGSITIAKETDPTGGSGFSFSGGFLGNFSLDDGESAAFDNLDAGDYTVTEVPAPGWHLDDVVCTGGDSDAAPGGVTVHLESGEDVICSFANESYVLYLPLSLRR